MPKASIEIRGKEHTWGVDWDAPQCQIDDMHVKTMIRAAASEMENASRGRKRSEGH